MCFTIAVSAFTCLLIGRLFDFHMLDMFELGIESFTSMMQFPVRLLFNSSYHMFVCVCISNLCIANIIVTGCKYHIHVSRKQMYSRYLICC